MSAGHHSLPAPRPVVTRASHADLDHLVRLEQAAFDPPWTMSALQVEIDQPTSHVFTISDAEQTPIGYACFRVLPPDSELLRLAVVPGRRRRGLARALLVAGFRAISIAGARGCWLEVRADNLAALRLYRTLSFHHRARRPGYYSDGADALILSRDLPPPSGGDAQ